MNLFQNSIALDKHYQFQVLTEKYLEQVIEVFTQSFCRSEPMTHYLKMDENKYKIFARTVAKKAVTDKFSVVALDGEKVIAFVLTEDIADPGPIPDFDPKFEYILGLLEKIGGDFFTNKTFEKKHIAHLFITAVDKNYRRQHLSTQINFFAMDIAKRAGFDFMYSELTHYYNEKGLIPHLKTWKQKIGGQIYNQFEMKNIKPFEFLNGGANSYLWKLHDDAELFFIHKYKESI